MIEIDTFIADVKAFLLRHDMKKTAFGRRALNDPSFVRRLFAKDSEPKLSTIHDVREWMKKTDREIFNGD